MDSTCSSAYALLVEFFTQVGAHTITVSGHPSTGPMQAVVGNRSAVRYSADALDVNIALIGGFSESTKAPLNEKSQRDSGVYTAYLGVNLRDQIREIDTVPLQFKYEAADCRTFYMVDDIYNMSPLWRDAVNAAFDGTSLYVEGSTSFKNSDQPASELTTF